MVFKERPPSPLGERTNGVLQGQNLPQSCPLNLLCEVVGALLGISGRQLFEDVLVLLQMQDLSTIQRRCHASALHRNLYVQHHTS